MKRLSAIILLFLFCFVLLVSGCASRQVGQAEEKKAAGSYEVKDSKGYVVKLAQKPQRIVSLSIGTDEILMTLVPLKRIAALTYLSEDSGISNISEQAKQVPAKIKANAEAVISLQPDLVLVPDWQSIELIQIMRDAGIAVYVYKSPNTIEQIKQVIAEIAHVVNEEQNGIKMIADMNTELDKITEKVKRIPPDKRKVVVQLTLMGGSSGKDSEFDDICHYAGAENGAAIAGLSMNEVLSKEQIVTVNPDVLLLPMWDYTGKTDMQAFKANVQADPALQTVKAIRQKQLFQVPDRHLYCSSQFIVYGVKDVASAAYPEYIGQE